ncbi:MAG: aminodeoxychorismate synthase component I [Bacteroidetes bacterium]|nr:MAG: aminodeoxychorismate synthase component I [Bacteroidota bacterium]
MNKNCAIQKMNRLGEKKIPFFFLSSFHQDENMVLTLEEVKEAGIYFHINQLHTVNPTQVSPFQKNFQFEKTPVGKTDYKQKFEAIQQELHYGNSYLLNLTQPTTIKTHLTLMDIYNQSQADYKLLIPNKLVVFSPETFVKTQGNTIRSFPMKGTIDAQVENAREKILNNQKEIAEHYTIVDLIRNDLSIISKNVRVERFRYISKIRTHKNTLLQVSSEIVGDIDAQFFKELGTRFFQLLPAGSISGAPKEKTVEIIDAVEGYDRGFYTGVFGFFDGERLDSGVMIRYIEQHNGQMIFKSGGGITIHSNMEDEYQELIDKVYVPIN